MTLQSQYQQAFTSPTLHIAFLLVFPAADPAAGNPAGYGMSTPAARGALLRAAAPYWVGEVGALSAEATRAIGEDGVQRLEDFRKLAPNWNGSGASTLREESVAAFSEFFRDTGIEPKELSIFMSPSGNVIVNWEDQNSNLTELEFQSDRVSYFFEIDNDVGSESRTDIGTSKLFSRLRKRA